MPHSYPKMTMATKTIEQDAKRLFAAHSNLIRRCIEGFSTFARDDGNGRIALGFIPHAPEKYARLSALYETTHHMLIGLYRLQKEGTYGATFEDWVNILRFDSALVRSGQGWNGTRELSEAEDNLRRQYERLFTDLLAFRQMHIKDILSYARQEAQQEYMEGHHSAMETFQAVADQYFDRQRRDAVAEEASEDTLPVREKFAEPMPLLKRMLTVGLFRN